MPVISLQTEELRALIGRDVPLDELKAKIPMMGAEIESADEREILAEFFPNRPDLYSVEGVARGLRGFLGIEPGLAKYEIAPAKAKLVVEPSVESVRPFIACGMVRGLRADDALIRSLMQMQEKLHFTVGRKRKKVAIGVHDAARLKPPYVYRAVKPNEVRFVPLGKTEEMDLGEILAKHEKGVDYAPILEGKELYPIIQDSEGQVLSFPPIINGTVTEVTEATGDIFLDVTGTDFRTNCVVLNIIACALADRGGKLEAVEVQYKDKTYNLPDLAPAQMSIELGCFEKMLGMELAAKDACEVLGRMRHGAKASGNAIAVRVPAYRSDVLHPIDLVEDIAIGHGYEKIPMSLPTHSTFARSRAIDAVSDAAADSLVGMGYLEASTLTLSCEEDQFDRMRLPRGQATMILNPATEENTCLRISLLPGLMTTLRANKHRELPQRLFEGGDVVVAHANGRRCAAVSVHPLASFTEMKSLVLALARDLGLKDVSVAGEKSPSYIEGRCASVSAGGRRLGVFGELHPEVVTAFDLANPVAAMELDLTKI
jgi:phenylalanyl-tRNA synthetase beta chain